ncbi:PAS domain-containing protein [Sporomusa sp. GT1]|uniref:PAS domain-containing protein n=1 Tax=Sporomusa sp. GT1 TaxID=1534747 RepID=UPI00166867F9|nr:PAS domain-containing protein [Sporomusa sp. GT1]
MTNSEKNAGLPENEGSRKMEQKDELRRQEMYLQIITEFLDQVVWRIDLETLALLDTSPSIKQLRGYEKDEIMGHTLKDMLTPSSYRRILERIHEWRAQIADAGSDGIKIFEVVEQPCRDGSTVWVEVACSLFRRTDGGAELVGISRSLGQQKGLADVCRQLADSERFLQVIWDAAPCMLTCMDSNGLFLLVNQRFADNCRIDRGSAPGRHFLEMLPDDPKIREQHEQIFAKCLTGQTVEFLNQYRPNGENSDYWVYGKYKPVMSADGLVKKVIAAIMDVTEQQEMKRQLTEAEKIGKTGSWYLHLPTGRFSCSDGLLALYASNRDEFAIQGRQIFWSRLQPEDQERIRQWEDLEWLAVQESLSIEVWLALPDGNTRLVWVKGNVRTDAAGQPAEIYGTVTDVTERRALEEARKKALLRLREFSRTMPGAGMIIDIEGIVAEVFDDNGLLAADAKTSWPGRKLNSLLPAESAENLLKAICYSINQGRLQFGEYTLELSHGRRTFDVRIAPLSCLKEEHPMAACYLTDTTEQRRTKALLESTYEKRRQRELLNDLAEGKLLPTQEVLDQAWQVNLNLTQDFSCYLLALESCPGKKDDQEQEQRAEQQPAVDLLLLRLHEEQDVIAWESRDGIALLVPVGSEKQIDKDYEIAQAVRWRELVHRHVPGSRCRIGIAEFHAGTFWQFAKVYEQAQLAVELGRKRATELMIQHYLDIGVFQFFPAVVHSRYAKDFMQRTLGRLVEYDRIQGTELMNTLEVILHTDNLTTVAKRLYVHRQTVLFRKNRIETVLGVSLDNFETRLALGMALKFRQVYSEKA